MTYKDILEMSEVEKLKLIEEVLLTMDKDEQGRTIRYFYQRYCDEGSIVNIEKKTATSEG